MKKLLYFYQFIVGSKYGFTGEGNEQWYYTLSLVINLMLVWWLCPEIGIVFTALSVIHYLTVVYYGVNEFAYDSFAGSCIYFGIHLVLFAVAAIVNIKWTIITSIITTAAVIIAPDCMGENIFLRNQEYKPNYPLDKSNVPLLFNTIIFATFVIVDFLLPIKLWIKFVILTIAMVLHPFIDLIEGECIIISDITYDALANIQRTIKSKKKK